MRFVVDGTTGLLGRNLLFEILKQNLKKLDEVEIIILGKGTNGNTLESRMNEIIITDGFDYFNLDRNSDYFNQIKSRIIYIEFDLTKTDLGLNQNALSILKRDKIDFFFHIAALLNFNDSTEITNKLYLVNFESSKSIIKLAKEINVKEIIYVSTAYSAGASQKEIYPDFINQTGKYRNPYEKSKLETELFLIEYAKIENLKYKIFWTYPQYMDRNGV